MSALALDLHRACREMRVDAYQSWAFGKLKAVVPFTAAKWVSGHMDARIPVIQNVLLVGRPQEMLADYDRVKREDFLTVEAVSNPDSARLANDLARRPGLSPSMLAYLAKWSVAHAIGICTIDSFTDLATGIGLWREAAEGPFSEPERKFFEAAMPHLIESYAVSRILHVQRAALSRISVLHASAVADPLAQLQVAPADFQRLLRTEWPDWRGARLPEQVRHLIDGTQFERFVGKHITLRSTRMNDVFLMQARDRHPADSLSERELEVARLCATGRTYKEIAQALDISPSTVRNHLSSVFAKLDIGKQSELAAALRILD